MDKDEGSAKIVKSVVNLGRDLSLEVVAEGVENAGLAKLLLGYAGWGEGQLEDELGENVWLTADADADLIFDPDYEGKWGRAVAGLGIDPAQLSGQSGRA